MTKAPVRAAEEAAEQGSHVPTVVRWKFASQMPQTTPMEPVEQLDPLFATQVGNGHLTKGVICVVSQGMTQ